ncbi:MAG: energy-coupling factor ABC transporter ATP-binding protein [Actinobacteria bacterium]|nr:energy-coupling factor ABC transporter ATP-binding protein [Actinomycetota bacterium]
MIVFDQVSHEFRLGTTYLAALRDVSLSLSEQRIGVIGANGSGKSTFVRMINGLIKPTAGRVTVDGLDTDRDGKAVRRRVGFCFTDPDAQILMPTVAEDLAFGLRGRGLSRDEVTDKVESTLAAYDLLGYRDHPASLLSGGQKQLLALASVLIIEPSVLVLDEPATLLDLANTQRVQRLIAQLPQQVVLVTHHFGLIEDSDRVLVFDAGRVVYDGAPQAAVAHYVGLVR